MTASDIPRRQWGSTMTGQRRSATDRATDDSASQTGSVTGHLGQLRAGNDDALTALWRRYYPALLAVARDRLGSRHRRVADEEDVVAQAFQSFHSAVRQGRYPDVRDRRGLWRLLLTITANQARDEVRKQRTAARGGGKVLGESALRAPDDSGSPDVFEHLISLEPSPEFAVAIAESVECRLKALPTRELRQIALLKLEGRQNREIAQRLRVTERTIERKLLRIRQAWLALEDD